MLNTIGGHFKTSHHKFSNFLSTSHVKMKFQHSQRVKMGVIFHSVGWWFALALRTRGNRHPTKCKITPIFTHCSCKNPSFVSSTGAGYSFTVSCYVSLERLGSGCLSHPGFKRGKTPAGRAELYLVIFIQITFCETTFLYLYNILNVVPYIGNVWYRNYN